jgi:preprotein translocase subunit SecB
MAKQKNKTPEGAGVAGDADNAPRATIVNQYIKDLSFENPNAYDVFKVFAGTTPKIDVAIDINGIKKADDAYEVDLKFTITTKQDDTSAFVIELVYSGLFAVKNMTEESVQPFLHIQAPFILFPFARRIIADVTRDGGYPPLMLDPIDFASLYQQRLEVEAGQSAANA